MRITTELSLYPIGEQSDQRQPLDKIIEFIGDISADDRLEVTVNQMSTQIRGELGDVMERIEAGLSAAFASGDSQVLVAKFLNADLPVDEAPDLGSVGATPDDR